MDYRLFALTSHYRNYLNFTWEALESAKESLKSLHKKTDLLIGKAGEIKSKEALDWQAQFKDAIGDDLNMPKALGIFNNVLRADLVESEKSALVSDFDKVLGLRLDIPREDYEKKAAGMDTAEIESLIVQRTEARKAKNWAESDRIRDVLADKGIVIKDSPQGTTWTLK